MKKTKPYAHKAAAAALSLLLCLPMSAQAADTVLGADVKVKNSIDSTALLETAQYGCDLEVARALLKAGADPNAKTRGGSTPLWWATYNKQDDLVALLKSAGARETP